MSENEEAWRAPCNNNQLQKRKKAIERTKENENKNSQIDMV